MEVLQKHVGLPSYEAVHDDVCYRMLNRMFLHAAMLHDWALRMIDSSSKIPEGLLVGTYMDLGNYDECLSVEVHEKWGSFTGQHCLARMDVNLSNVNYLLKENVSGIIPVVWSLCVPSVCSAKYLRQTFHRSLHFKEVKMSQTDCHSKGDRPFTMIDWAATGVICLFLLLSLLSTIYDLNVTDTKKRKQSLLAFSWYTNGKQLLRTKSSEGAMECLNGIRFLTILWIILGHIYFISSTVPSVNVFDFLHDVRNWGHEFVTTAFIGVDTFLFLSGLLLCYIFLKSMHKGKKFNIFQFYIHRYIRTTPVLAISVLVHAGLIMHMSSGPLWDRGMGFFPNNCNKNWWTALLHIQNYVNIKEMCIPVSWYLSVDMQLYLLSPLFLIPLFKWPRVGFISLQVGTVAAIISCFLQMYTDADDTPLLKLGLVVPDNYFYTHTRAISWFIGMSMGFILYETSVWRKEVIAGTRKGLSKKIVAAGWLATVVCLLVPILAFHEFTQEVFPSTIYVTVYATGYRILWSLGISWIVFACVSGHGGPVNGMLSWKIFVPLSRLTYCIYIIHMSFIRVKVNSIRTPTYYDDTTMILALFSTIVFVTLLAIPTAVMFEYPAIVIEKALLGGSRKKPERKISSPTDNTDIFCNGKKMKNVMASGSGIKTVSYTNHMFRSPPEHPQQCNTVEGNSV